MTGCQKYNVCRSFNRKLTVVHSLQSRVSWSRQTMQTELLSTRGRTNLSESLEQRLHASRSQTSMSGQIQYYGSAAPLESNSLELTARRCVTCADQGRVRLPTSLQPACIARHCFASCVRLHTRNFERLVSLCWCMIIVDFASAHCRAPPNPVEIMKPRLASGTLRTWDWA